MKYSQEFDAGSRIHSAHIARLRQYLYYLPESFNSFPDKVDLTIGNKTFKVREWGVLFEALRGKYNQGQNVLLTADGNFPENQLEKFIKDMGEIFEMDLD